jgi:1-deoxy-D-xylulose-5-phosphate reductoisomerase
VKEQSMVKNLTILGSTGSIGRQSVAVAEHLHLPVAALTTNRKIELLEQQARRLHPAFVAAYDPESAKQLKTALADTDTRVGSGMEGLIEAACLAQCDCVVTAVSGSVGLRPTLAAISEKKRIALANKETLVCAGSLVMRRASDCGAEIVPVDSEHSAIFQCLIGRGPGELRKILLTGSGGPFRGRPWNSLSDIQPEEAVRHPNWHMGAKISVDSATMMNKGLEFIEAMHLFSVSPDAIQVVVHPQSIVHSMVELVDGTVLAQLGVANMELPIQFALTYPDRMPSLGESLDFWQMQDLHFEKPDYDSVPCLRLAMECARTGGLAPCILSAANETAVHLFLNHKIGYTRIYDEVQAAVHALGSSSGEDLETILEADREARKFVSERCR